MDNNPNLSSPSILISSGRKKIPATNGKPSPIKFHTIDLNITLSAIELFCAISILRENCYGQKKDPTYIRQEM